ncbi:phage major capsid protein [Microbacterium sp. NPDC077057]|uniref:phage major capsid protein n=1 Tax=unclassified Microbacterium TaxID=2609290 RepID=UPI003443F1C5
MDIKSELAALQQKNNALVLSVKASGRQLSTTEVEQMEQDADRIIQLKAAIARGESNAAVIDRLNSGLQGVEDVSDGFGGAKSVAATEAKSGFLDLSPAGIKSMARTMADQATEQKALVAGGTVTTQVTLAPNIVRMGGGGLALMSALPVIQHDTPSWKYLRQSVRTNAAAEVAVGATKPTSTVTVTDVDGQLRVFATLSEPVDKYLIRDSAALQRFVGQELVYMVGTKVQAAAVAAFLATSGIQTVSAAAEPIVSVRKGIQAVEDLGFSADLIVLNSADYFDIVTTRNAGGTFDVSNGVGATEEAPRLWGRQVVSVTEGVAAGSALVLDRSAVAIDTDKVGLETEWNPYAGFDNNTVKARTEGRFDFSVFQPSALALVDLAGE